MAYNLSAFAGAGAQFFDDNGNVLSGGKIYTYAAGTTTPVTTYANNLGSSANTNPIILDAAGRTPSEVWLVSGQQLKFIVKTSADVTIGTYDNISPINDTYDISSLLTNIAGTNAILAVATPTITSYAAGATYSFVAVNTNTDAVTISIDGLTAKSVTKGGSVALTAGDIQANELVHIQYDGTRFQVLNNVVYGGGVTNATITNSTITDGTISGITDLAIADGGTGASTAFAAFDNIKQAATATYVGAVELATDAEVNAGTDTTRAMTPAAFRAGNIVSGTAVTTTSGTTVDFTGIPSWAKRVTVLLAGVSTNSTSALLLQLGTSSGLETSGYLGTVTNANGSTITSYSAGFTLTVGEGASDVHHGIVTVCLVNSNLWAESHYTAQSDSAAIDAGAGSKSLSAVLDRVRITTVGGTATFDAGTINVMWE